MRFAAFLTFIKIEKFCVKNCTAKYKFYVAVK